MARRILHDGFAEAKRAEQAQIEAAKAAKREKLNAERREAYEVYAAAQRAFEQAKQAKQAEEDRLSGIDCRRAQKLAEIAANHSKMVEACLKEPVMPPIGIDYSTPTLAAIPKPKYSYTPSIKLDPSAKFVGYPQTQTTHMLGSVGRKTAAQLGVTKINYPNKHA